MTLSHAAWEILIACPESQIIALETLGTVITNVGELFVLIKQYSHKQEYCCPDYHIA